MLSERRAHTILPVPDLEDAREFYEGVLGFAPRMVGPTAIVYEVGEGSLVAISRTTGRASGTHTQLAFTVPDLAVEMSELRARGIVFQEYESPQTVNGVAQMPGAQAAWFEDPVGNIIALVQYEDPF